MKQLNMMVDDDVKQAAVDGAKADGMLLNKWVSKAIHERRLRQLENQPTQEAIRKSLEQQAMHPVELSWTPTWENEFLTDVWKYFPKEGMCVGRVVKISAARWDAHYRDEQIGSWSTREQAQAAIVAAWKEENS